MTRKIPVTKKTDTPASPTIREVLTEFLTEQKSRLSPKTYTQYKYVYQLLQMSLDGYGPNSLDKAETKLYEKINNNKEIARREYCDIFGPDYILPNLWEFLDYFMVRKVAAGKDLLQASGAVTKKLAVWLKAKGYAEAEEAEVAVKQGRKAARDLPKADELSNLLYDFACVDPSRKYLDRIEDHFEFTRVEPGKIWVESIGGKKAGPFAVPEDISDMCTVGWTFSGTIGSLGGKWKILEAWNVYPR